MVFGGVERWPKILKRLRQYLFENRPRTFIVPTGFGFIFALLCLFLFILAAGSGNNLVYAYVFFIISMALVGTYFTNRNIDSLSFALKPEGFLFAGERSCLVLKTLNSQKNTAVNMQVSIEKGLEAWSINELPGMAENVLKIFWIPSRRGYHPVPTVRVQSAFPFGLLRAWQTFAAKEIPLIFPKREGAKELPKSSFESSSDDVSGLFKGSSSFQSSDSILRIDWRTSAKKQELFVKRFENPPYQKVSLFWEQTVILQDFEQRISQLALWVDEAEKLGFFYSMEIGKEKIEMGKGQIQWIRCMEALAKMDKSEFL